jgi:A/G-specific adenine glycosylase
MRGAGQVNQALMELGSQICRPAAPMCHVCPVARYCQAFQLGLQEQLPRKQRTRPADRVTEAAVVIRRRERVLLRECQENERWAGMWDFPRFHLPGSCGRNVAGELAAQASQWAGCHVEIGDKLAQLRHSVTRFCITLHCFEGTFVSNQRRLPAECRWVALRDLSRYPLNVTARRLSQQL